MSLLECEICAAVDDWAFGEYTRTKKWPGQIERATKAAEIMLQLKQEDERIRKEVDNYG